MAVQSPYLTIDGDLNGAKRKLSGESLADQVWPQQGQTKSPLLPDASKFNSPPTQVATSTIPVVAGGGGSTLGDSEDRVLAGAHAALKRLGGIAEGNAKLGVGVLGAPTALAIDMGRQGIASARGATLENPYAARDVSGRLMSEGVDGFSRAFDGADTLLGQAGARVDKVIGAVPRSVQPADTVPIPKGGQSIVDQSIPTAAAIQPKSENQWSMTGSGIAARVGPSGVAEFSNDQAVVDSAQPMPAGGISGASLRAVGVSNVADGTPLAERGSINNVGNGIGTFSQGQAGDAARAIAQFDAANAIRGEQLPGVRVAGTGYQNPLTAGQFAAQRQQDRRAAVRQESGLRERELVVKERGAQREEETAELDVAGRRRLEGLTAIMSDMSASPEDRENAMRIYTSLTTQAKDRYILQDEQVGEDALGGAKYGKVAYDVTTGSRLGASQSEGQKRVPAVGTLQGGYEFLGGDPADQKNWRKA